MQVEPKPHDEPTLIVAIRDMLARKAAPEVFDVYIETLVSDVEALAKSPIASVPNAYVYVYAVAKKYLERFGANSTQKAEHLFEFYHVVFNCLFNDDSGKLTALLQRDDTLEQVILGLFQAHGSEGKSAKYLFDVLLICLRAKEAMPTANHRAPEVLQLVLQSSISEDEFLSRKSQKFIGQILDLKSQSLATLLRLTQEFITPVLDSWFIKSKEAVRILDLLKRVVPFFTSEVKLDFLRRLLGIAEGKSPAQAKTKVFDIAEAIFASGFFSLRDTQSIMESLVRMEDHFVQFLTDRRLVVAFFKARLQVLLNFYSLDPLAARPFIPSFVSSLFEFFAHETFEDVAHALEDESEPAKKPKARQQGKDRRTRTPEPAVQTPQKAELAETFKFYKRFSFRMFELLIANAFDFGLFSELSGGNADESLAQVADLLHNMDLEEEANSFAGKSSVFKLFALMDHTISARFEENFEFTLRIITKMVDKVADLGFRSSVGFNEHLAKFYMSSRALLKGEGLKPASANQLDVFMAEVLGAGDLELLIPLIFNLKAEQQFDVRNLENPDFVAFLHTLSRRGNHFRFAALHRFLGMVLQYSLEEHLKTGGTGDMEVEQEEGAEGTTDQLFRKLETNLVRQIVSSIHRFDVFTAVDTPKLDVYATYLVQTMLQDQIYDDSFLTKQFLGVFNGLMLFVVSGNVKLPKPVLDRFEALIKSSNLLPKVCKNFIRWASHKDKLHFENFLKLYAKLFPNDATAQIVQKNATRLEKLLKSNEKEQSAKAVGEGAIIVNLLMGFEQLARFNDLLVLSLKFAQALFDSGAPNAVKLAFKVLGALLTNLHPSQFGQVLSVVEGVMAGFLQGQFADRKFENSCLKFVSRLMHAYATNLPLAEFRTKVEAFCEKYLNLVVFNFKNRNKKTRKAAQAVLSEMFQRYHAIEAAPLDSAAPTPANKVIDEKSFLVCCLIAGLAAETDVAKANCVEALAFVVKEFAGHLSPTLVHSITRVALLLVKGHNSEVFTSVLKFVSRVIKKQDVKDLEADLPLVIEGVFEWDPESTKRASAKIKTFIAVLNKKFVV